VLLAFPLWRFYVARSAVAGERAVGRGA
jgi:hypothetical protein